MNSNGQRTPATRYFKVVNWEKFQHYGDRVPPWIKVYRTLLDNYEFSRLPDAAKWHLVGIWLLASRHKNRLPFDPAWIRKETQAHDDVDLQRFVDAGFIKLINASTVLAARKQNIVLDEEEDKDTDKDPPTPQGGDCPGFERFWNEWPKHRRKVAKAKCARHWKSAGLEAEADAIIAAVGRSKSSRDWLKDGGDFIPMPSTWLNERRWEAVVATDVPLFRPSLTSTQIRGEM